MGRYRKKGGKAEKKHRRNRWPLDGDRCFRQLQSRKPKETGDMFPKELMGLLNDEPELSVEDIRKRAIKRAEEARKLIKKGK